MDHRDVVTRLTVAALLAGLIGAAAVMAQSDGPPPPRTFGSDTTAVGVFTGQGTTAPGLQCDAPPDVSIPLECSGFLASGLDGTLLDVTVRVPQTAGPHPLVVYVHGWGGSKNAGHQYDDVLAGAGKADAAGLTRGGGYTYLRYSTRGFGKSWGQTNFGDVDVELADLRSMVGQVVDDPRLQADPTAVAVMGASYGGAHSWLAAAQPSFTSLAGKSVRLRTAVPVAAGSDLLYSLIPNGKPNDATSPAGGVKLSYVNGFYATGHNPTALARNLRNARVFVSAGDGTPTSGDGTGGGVGNAEEAGVIRPMSDAYDAALKTAGINVTYQTHNGCHCWPDFQTELRHAIAWGPFKPVVGQPKDWVNDTVATHGQLWDITYRFESHPSAVVRFTRRGSRIRISAAGTPVTLTTSRGCILHLATPANVQIPSTACARGRRSSVVVGAA